MITKITIWRLLCIFMKKAYIYLHNRQTPLKVWLLNSVKKFICWSDKIISGISWWYIWWNLLISGSAMNISTILQRSIAEEQFKNITSFLWSAKCMYSPVGQHPSLTLAKIQECINWAGLYDSQNLALWTSQDSVLSQSTVTFLYEWQIKISD